MLLHGAMALADSQPGQVRAILIEQFKHDRNAGLGAPGIFQFMTEYPICLAVLCLDRGG
jgi:hypothetical protein